MTKHFLLSSALIVFTAMVSCSPEDGGGKKTYTDQLAPPSLERCTITWSSDAPGDTGGGGKIQTMSLNNNRCTSFGSLAGPGFMANATNRYQYYAVENNGYLSLDLGAWSWQAPGAAHIYGAQVDGVPKTFFSRDFFATGADYTQRPFRITYTSFDGFGGYKGTILVPRGAVWGGEMLGIASPDRVFEISVQLNY